MLECTVPQERNRQLTRMAWDRICNNFTIHILTFSILVIFWFLVKMHFKGLHGRQNREFMVPNSYLITGLILPGNYATFGQKGTKNNNKSLNNLCVNLEKNNLNQQNRQYIYKTEESRKNISHSFISGFTKWLQCKSKFVNIWKITRQFFFVCFHFFLSSIQWLQT